MEATSTAPRIAPIYWIAGVLFVLLFTAFFPVMIGLGLRSSIFWGVFALLWACAAVHGRLTKDERTEIRHGLRPVLYACTIVSVVIFVRSAIRLLTGESPSTLQWDPKILTASLLASFCAIGALSNSYKRNPS